MYRQNNLRAEVNKYIETNRSRMTKIISAFMLVFLIFGSPVFIPIPVYSQSLTEEKSILQQEVDAINVKLFELKQQKNTLANQLAIFDAQIYAIQVQINASQGQIDLLSGQITELNTKIVEAENNLIVQKNNLKEYLKVMYMDGQTSQIELILTSNNFSDFVDRSEYMDTMQNKIQETMDKIEKTKIELDASKKTLEVNKSIAESLKASQIEDRQAIDVQAAEKQSLLNQTKGEESGYKTILTGKAARINEINDALNAAAGAGASSGTFYGVPYYSQTNPSWADYDINYISGSPMRSYGCAITSLSMLFASYGYYKDPGQIAHNYKYFSGDLMAWYNIPWATDYRFNNIDKGLNIAKGEEWATNEKPFLVAINDAFGVGLDHYVVIIGKRGGSWVMNDPIRGGNLDFNNYYGFGSKYIEQTVFISM